MLFPKAFNLRNIKHFPCLYTVISTRVEIRKTRNCVEIVFSHSFEFFQFSRHSLYVCLKRLCHECLLVTCSPYDWLRASCTLTDIILPTTFVMYSFIKCSLKENHKHILLHISATFLLIQSV